MAQVLNKTSLPVKTGDDQSPVFAKKILSVSLILIVIATVGVLTMGLAALSASREIKEHEYFVSVAKEVRPNFEDSLVFYTGDTQTIIGFLLSLRPNTEEEYITFITALEALGNDLSLNLDIRSVEIDGEDSQTSPEPSNTLDYDVNFYGSFRDLKAFVNNTNVVLCES